MIIFTSSKYNIEKYEKLKKLGVQIREVELDNKKLLSIDEILSTFKQTNIKTILVEGGAKVTSNFLNKKLVDIIFIYRADCFIGSESLNMVDKIEFNQDFEFYHEVFLGNNKLEVWINKNLNKIQRSI